MTPVRDRRYSLCGVVGSSRPGFRLGEDLSGEDLDARTVPPGIGRKPRLEAGLFQKFLPTPSIFRGDLGKQQAALIAS